MSVVSKSLWDLGYFSNTLYPVSFSVESLTRYFPHHSHLEDTIGFPVVKETTGYPYASDLHSLGDLHFSLFLDTLLLSKVHNLFRFFFSFSATPVARGSSQGRDRI